MMILSTRMKNITFRQVKILTNSIFQKLMHVKQQNNIVEKIQVSSIQDNGKMFKRLGNAKKFPGSKLKKSRLQPFKSSKNRSSCLTKKNPFLTDLSLFRLI